MAFNISGFLGHMVSNPSVSEKSSSDTGSVQQENTVNAQYLNGLLAGDTLTGVISSVKNNQVLLSLPGGESLFARLSADAQVQLGQSMTFMVQENTGNFISLKPLYGDAQQMVMVQKALEAAGLAYNEGNAAIVEGLLSRKMSIDSAMINEMIKNNLKFPDTSFDTIANLVKLNIPVTEQNIQQYEAYTHYEHNMAGQLNSIPENLSESLVSILENDTQGLQETASFLKNITAAFYQGIPEETQGQPVSTLMDDTGRTVFAQKLTAVLGDAAQELAAQVKEGSVSAKEVMTQISGLLEKFSADKMTSAAKEELQQLFSSKEMGQLFQSEIQETMYLTPQEAGSPDSIKDFYKRVRAALESASDQVKKASLESQLSKNLNEVKSNIDFMNDLNRNMTYFQMPVRFSEGTGNGELYVFTNKKALKNSTDNISALLHLDMEHLGPLDVYVKLSGKNVSTNFCLESEEMLDFVYAHIDRLNDRLTALGYTPHFEMKLAVQEEPFDFEKDFLHSTGSAMGTSQYIFDMKA